MSRGISGPPTERRLARALQSAIELVSDAVLVADSSGTVRETNPAASAMFGASSGALQGTRMEDLLPGVLSCEGATERLEVEARRLDGTPFPARISLRRFDDNAVAVVVTDLSELKAQEARLHAAQRMETVGLLAGGIAHDFNNLLMIIAGCCESLRRSQNLSDAQRTGLDQIAVAAEQATSLTSQLLALNRRATIEPAVIDLHVALEQTRRLLDRTMGEDISIAMELAPGPAYVRMNRSDAGQILINLAINARDAMPGGGTFTVRTTIVDGQRPSVELTVSDTGSGMTPETRARAFEPFFTTKPAGGGTGLGLASVARIVKAAGGDIRLDSAPGAGTSVVILLPMAEAPRTAAPDMHAAAAAPAGNATALVVEDDPAVREIVVTMLRDLGYRTLEASGLPEAIAVTAAAKGSVDILVSDMVLPDVAGTELADQLRRQIPSLKVLFMSGDTDEEAPAHFIRKPFTRNALARKVREVLDAPSTLSGSPS